MKFYYKYTNNTYEGITYMTDDTSILSKKTKDLEMELDYTVSLGGNPRYLMDLSHKTGRCGQIRCFMDRQKVYREELKIPKYKKGELYFMTDEEMTEYSGSQYMLFEDKCYYDEKKNILCLGNPYLQGKTIEFISNIYATVKENRLIAIFLIVDSLQEKVTIRRGKFHRRY